MKLMGSMLLLWSAGMYCLLRRRVSREVIQLMETLLQDLAVLKSRICTLCIPLPQLLDEELSESAAGKYLWDPLLRSLKDERSLAKSWELTVWGLPPPMGRILAPVGPLLSRGGTALSRAIDETREELTESLRVQRQKRAAADKLAAALYLSGAGLTILVLI